MSQVIQATSISAFPKAIKEEGLFDMKKATGEFVIDVGLIDFTPEWNIRPICRTQVEALKNARLNGETLDPFELEPVQIDGKNRFRIVDGHHTYVAIKELFDANSDDGKHKATMFKGSESDKLVRAFNSTQGLPLTPMQACRTFQRMLDEGMSRKEIAKRVSKPLAYVSDVLFLSNADSEMVAMIDSNVISASRAKRLLREQGENATAFAKLEAGNSIHTQLDNSAANTPLTGEDSANDSRISTESATESTIRKASKRSTQMRSVSNGKTTAAFELLTAINKRLPESGESLELNPLLLNQIKELASYYTDIQQHNTDVANQLKQIS
ncbi:ParB/RepB/Spo0J family partition protein [Vibrio sp. TRT 29B02]|uniref:ParB/RepB/Spo0J family partition protein n=1 Tax=Vibrio sp. TRT 29B02 TaxID=3418508 RepID=UPI003CEAD9A1